MLLLNPIKHFGPRKFKSPGAVTETLKASMVGLRYRTMLRRFEII
jgi:hypothetical protein